MQMSYEEFKNEPVRRVFAGLGPEWESILSAATSYAGLRRAIGQRAKYEALIRAADKLLRESWNQRMRTDGEPIDPSPSVDQAINGRLYLA